MPFNRDAMKRRRTLLRISQHNLGVISGLHPATIGNIERGALPNDGSGLGIDVMMRIAEALQMEYHELLIPPTGNRYQRAAEFAKAHHSRVGAPHLHDDSDTIKSRGFRKLTEVTARDADLERILEPEEDDAPEIVDHGAALDATLYGYNAVKVTADEDGNIIRERINPAELGDATDTTFHFPDTSTE